MKPCLFLAIEGLTAEALASGRLPALEAIALDPGSPLPGAADLWFSRS